MWHSLDFSFTFFTGDKNCAVSVDYLECPSLPRKIVSVNCPAGHDCSSVDWDVKLQLCLKHKDYKSYVKFRVSAR